MQCTPNHQKGFVALVAVIIIGVVLLGIAVDQSLAGWYARFNVLSAEDKERAMALAEGCADIAFATFVSDTRFDTSSVFTDTYQGGACSVSFDTSVEGIVTLKSQGVVGQSYATLTLSMNVGDLALGGALETPENGTLFVSVLVEGAALPEEFTVSVQGGTPEEFPGTSARAVSIPGGGTYRVLVSGPSGYDTSYIGDCDSSGRGDVGVAMTDSCVLLLEPTKTTVTFLVHVINDDGGGSLPSNFPLTLGGTVVEEGVPLSLSPGTYDVDEDTSQTVYTVSDWEGVCDDDGSFDLSLGEEALCEITYDDTAGGAFCVNTDLVAPVSSTGGNMWQNPLGVLQGDGVYASSNTGASGDYFGFPIDAASLIPPSDSIRAVTVYTDASSSSPQGCALGIRLSWDGGTSWTNEKTRTLQGVVAPYTFGGTSAWTGHTFTPEEVTNQSLFRVKMRDVDPGTSCVDTATVFVDTLRASVSHGSPSCALVSGTPTAPEQGTLIIETRITNDSGGTLAASDFAVSVGGETFPGVPSPGKTVVVDPGAYSVTSEQHNRYKFTAGASCTSSAVGDIQKGEVRHCVLLYDDVVVTSLSESLDITIGSWIETPK